MSTIRRIALAGCALAAAAAVAAPSAHAGLLVASATDCDAATASKPFTPWLDYADYVLTPDGTFEGGSGGWSLDAASVVAENEPFHVNAASDSSGLRVEASGRATSASMCVGVEHPTLRFFARRADGSSLASLRVDVLFEDSLGLIQRSTIGEVVGGDSWAPTAPFPVQVNLLPLLPGERTAVAFEFVADDSAAWVIDDVYVDPYQGR